MSLNSARSLIITISIIIIIIIIIIILFIIIIIIMRLFFFSSVTVKPWSWPDWIMESYAWGDSDFWVCGWNPLVLVQLICICNRFCRTFKWFCKVIKIWKLYRISTLPNFGFEVVRSGESYFCKDLSSVHIHPFHLNDKLNLFFPQDICTLLHYGTSSQ